MVEFAKIPCDLRYITTGLLLRAAGGFMNMIPGYFQIENSTK